MQSTQQHVCLSQQLVSYWIKWSLLITAPGKAKIKYTGERSTAGPEHHSSSNISGIKHQTAAIRPLKREEPFSASHGLCLFGCWITDSVSAAEQLSLWAFSSASDTGKWAMRWGRAGRRGSWTGRNPFGLAPPPDSTPCFHAYREVPPPAPALPPLEKARGRSSPRSRSPRTPAIAEESLCVSGFVSWKTDFWTMQDTLNKQTSDTL